MQLWNETTVADWSPRTITEIARLPVPVREVDIPLGPNRAAADAASPAGATRSW